MNDEVEIIRSNKGGMKVIHRGYMYTVHKKRQGGGIRWRCTQRSLHCKGSISTGNGPPSVNMPHNHIPDPHSVALARCRQIEEEFPDITSLLETEYDENKDAMPFHQRMQLTPKIQIPTSDSPLQTQPLSPTKLKLTRNITKPASSTPKVIDIPTPPAEEVCLRWNSHHSNMQTSFPQLLEMEKYVDVTLIAEGKILKCHRVILSSCSPYFEEILNGISPLQHPVVILNGISFWILKMLTDFMYAGEVNIDQNKVQELLDVAEILKVKGLASKSNNQIKQENDVGKKSVEKNNINSKAPNILSKKSHIVPKLEESPISDPLQLLETKFLEVPLSKPREYRTFPKKIINKKIRKRRSSDDESTPSPPLLPIRRGTRSRPYVKVPKYYDYEDIVKPMGTESPQDTLPFAPVNIKTEPPEVIENDFQNANETLPCSASTSEYTDINDIASKLQSLEKSLDIRPIPLLFTKPSDIPALPYKLKIKSLSSMSEKASSSANQMVKEDVANSELTNRLEASSSSSSTTKIIDIGDTNDLNQITDVCDVQDRKLPNALEQDKQ